MSATARSTSSAASRPTSRKARKAGSKSGLRASSSCGMGSLPKEIDPARDFLGPGLEGCTVHDQPAGDLGNGLYLDQIVGREGGAAGNQIDDAAAEPQAGRQFHGAIQLDALRLDTAAREVGAGNFRIFRRNPDMAPARRIVLRVQACRLGDGEAAAADAQIHRRIDLRVGEVNE